MHLIVFDVDETLIDTGTVDSECFWQTAKEIFRLPSNYPTWVEGLKHVTGLCILSQLCEQALAQKITASELDRFKARFVATLDAAVRRNMKCIRAMPGAADVLAALRATAGFEAAIATGCFLPSAEFKLQTGGLLDPDIPIASCDDALSREEIMAISANRAVAKTGSKFSAVTYVGDGVWDFQAAQRLGWNFIGIGAGDAAARLTREGAVSVFAKFQLEQRIFRCHIQSVDDLTSHAPRLIPSPFGAPRRTYQLKPGWGPLAEARGPSGSRPIRSQSYSALPKCEREGGPDRRGAEPHWSQCGWSAGSHGLGFLNVEELASASKYRPSRNSPCSPFLYRYPSGSTALEPQESSRGTVTPVTQAIDKSATGRLT
jgi:phosphoglycolate phosphatase-like HAD superfamily hydrolase